MAKVSLRAYNREIEAMMDRGQLDEVISHCHHILKTFPKHLETYRLLGKAYLESKRYSDAVDIFSRVLVSVPNDFVAQVGMSIIRDEENKLDDAIWHMERAFETQPSNAAIQGELQRLYGRRDGVQPPRIRMTRGALAHMYVQGELYPQAISEIKSVLKEDAGRSDMQALLARACYRSGSKNEAAEVASSLLRRYPYCLDANRVLVEILGADRPDGVQVYRQRVVELDPYAAQVTGTVFQSGEVPDAAVSLERLDWNGQPVGVQADWRETQGISLEAGSALDEKPEWLKSGYAETTFPPRFDQAQREPSKPMAVPAFDSSTSPTQPPVGEEDIPDFLRSAGWGQSTGAFDESKPVFGSEGPAPAEPIEQGDLPDWVKAMAPAEASQPPAEEEMPDWINQIGTGVLASSSAELSAPSGDQPDWMSQSAGPAQPASFAEKPQDQPDWLSQLDQPEPAPSEPASSDFEFLNQTTEVQDQPAPDVSPTSMTDTGRLGTSDQERDDSFAWLENLAAKQGASEGLLTKPEDRLQDEPDWVQQAKALTGQAAQTPAPVLQPDDAPTAPGLPQVGGDLEELGKSEQERDDSFAWLEGLAAKQGASEGLLTRPEERLEKEPEWVKQAKDLGAQSPPVMEQPPAHPPAIEQAVPADDTAAWLRSLDEVEEKPAPLSENDETAIWLKSLDEVEAPPAPQPVQTDTPSWMQSLDEGKSDSMPEAVLPPIEEAEITGGKEVEEPPSWLSSLEAPASEAAPKLETGGLPSWLRGLDKEGPSESTSGAREDLPAWLRDETGELVAEPTKIEPTRATDWQSAEAAEPELAATETPSEMPEPKPVPVTPSPKAKRPAPKKSELQPASPPEPYREPVTRKGTGMLTMTGDMVLGQARNELSRSNIPGALETYGKLIKKGRYLDEVIFDLREALYRYPVEVSVWQSLGDAYMRANRLQDALDAYTKAEELLR